MHYVTYDKSLRQLFVITYNMKFQIICQNEQLCNNIVHRRTLWIVYAFVIRSNLAPNILHLNSFTTAVVYRYFVCEKSLHREKWFSKWRAMWYVVMCDLNKNPRPNVIRNGDIRPELDSKLQNSAGSGILTRNRGRLRRWGGSIWSFVRF